MLALLRKIKSFLGQKKQEQLPTKLEECLIGDIRKLHEVVKIKKIAGNLVKGSNLEGTLTFEAIVHAEPQPFGFIKTRLPSVKIFKGKVCMLNHNPGFRQYDNIKEDVSDLYVKICMAINGWV